MEGIGLFDLFLPDFFARIPILPKSRMYRYLLILSLGSLTSCAVLKKGGGSTASAGTSIAQAYQNQPKRFIDDISVTPPQTRVTFIAQSDGIASSGRGPVANTNNAEFSAITRSTGSGRTLSLEGLSELHYKYAVLLEEEVESLPNLALLRAADEWYGTPYRYGGNGRTGIDCSAFTMAVYLAAYGVQLPRVSRDQYKLCRKISTTELNAGDLLFFRTTGRGVSHVGIYLGNNKFIHASTSNGVTVSDMYEPYFLKRFVGAGRLSEDNRS